MKVAGVYKITNLITGDCYIGQSKDIYHNTHQKGSSNGMAKLTEEDVIKIRKKFVKNEKWQDVYEDYKDKLTKGSFFNVWRGYNWKHIMPDIYKKD